MAKLDDVLIDPFEKLYAEDVPNLKVAEIKESKKKKLKEDEPEPIREIVPQQPVSTSGLEKQLVEAALFTSTKPLKVDEISKIVGKPLNTVKSHHLRALHQMRLHLRI